MNEQGALMNQQQQQLMNMNQSLLNAGQMNPQMAPMNRSYGMWGPQQQFQNPNMSSDAMKPPRAAFNKSLGPRRNWNGKRVNKPIDKRRIEQQQQSLVGGIGGGNLNFRNYNPPTLNELQHQNRVRARKTFPKKKFNKNMSTNMGGNGGRSAPFAPRNTTSFLIRAKKSGGITSVVSPFPVTPSVLPTPILSPSTEVLGNMAKEEWGVDGYGSMKGLIRLRSLGQEDEEEDEGESSESDVEEHVEVERRLDHDLSRFEMIYDPNSGNAMTHHNALENRVDDQDSHIAQLEEENLNLKERLFLMEGELGDLRRRLLLLERRGGRVDDTGEEEVVENESENERESYTHSTGENGEGDRSEVSGGFEAVETRERCCVEGRLQIEDEGMKMIDKDDDRYSNANDSIEADKSAATESVDDESCKLVVETEEKLGC
ncbi:uncharacterized protein LOC130993426 [Salvia miltiorrhiza]|uniref:uncharacterized protein LOC130993426 n=1 Tax=Salvia miltiorrhiza TaxID=226208 RepID=UPI0025AB8514|nr:uncharacterized protein LOC130993426 [Salvia miltiorrhiza]